MADPTILDEITVTILAHKRVRTAKMTAPPPIETSTSRSYEMLFRIIHNWPKFLNLLRVSHCES